MSISLVSGALQPYAWGRVNALTEFVPEAEPGPHAELWFGTHPSAPSPHVDGEQAGSGRAPLLLKILAAASPLSIQVHPDAEGIARLLGDPSTAGLLTDAAVKDEALIAIERFDVLAGLREVENAVAVFEAAGPACEDVVRALRNAGVLAAIRILLDQPRQVDFDALQAYLPLNEAAVMAQVLEKYADDPAVLVAFLMQPRNLEPGDAMYVPAGSVHAYVNGLAVEVMAASDNVLRLGLTPKHIAVEPALSISHPDRSPIIGRVGDGVFAPEGAPFAVLRVQDSRVQVPVADAIALAYSGKIHDASSGLTAQKGQAFLLHTAGHELEVEGTAYITWPTR